MHVHTLYIPGYLYRYNARIPVHTHTCVDVYSSTYVQYAPVPATTCYLTTSRCLLPVSTYSSTQVRVHRTRTGSCAFTTCCCTARVEPGVGYPASHGVSGWHLQWSGKISQSIECQRRTCSEDCQPHKQRTDNWCYQAIGKLQQDCGLTYSRFNPVWKPPIYLCHFPFRVNIRHFHRSRFDTQRPTTARYMVLSFNVAKVAKRHSIKGTNVLSINVWTSHKVFCDGQGSEFLDVWCIDRLQHLGCLQSGSTSVHIQSILSIPDTEKEKTRFLNEPNPIGSDDWLTSVRQVELLHLCLY